MRYLLAKLRVILATIMTIVLSLIDAARKDHEFAQLVRETILRAVPEGHKREADKWICRILDIRARVLPYDRARPYYRTTRDQKPPENGD